MKKDMILVLIVAFSPRAFQLGVIHFLVARACIHCSANIASFWNMNVCMGYDGGG